MKITRRQLIRLMNEEVRTIHRGSVRGEQPGTVNVQIDFETGLGTSFTVMRLHPDTEYTEDFGVFDPGGELDIVEFMGKYVEVPSWSSTSDYPGYLSYWWEETQK